MINICLLMPFLDFVDVVVGAAIFYPWALIQLSIAAVCLC